MSLVELPNISLVTILHDNIEFYPLLQHHWDTLDYPKDKLEWILVDDSKEDHGDLIPIHENILYMRVDSSEYLEKIEFPKDEEKTIWNYYDKMKKLTNGFMRDYAVGMTSYDYIFHIDIDTIYRPKAIRRKLRFLKDHRLDCVYCKSMLCYDIYGKQLYKTEGQFGYESTLFHTKELWKKNGFKWTDIHSEAVAFYYNKGNERKMDNFYDTIKLLSIKNSNSYKPVRITLENMEIKIPEIVDTIKIEKHPFIKKINQLFDDRITLLGINSDFLTNVTDERWDTFSSPEKWKQTKLSKQIKELGNEFNVLVFGSKYPAWDLFNHIPFDIILLETSKNYEQMCSIILNSKKEEYLKIQDFFVRKSFLE